jgi:hypothetical protein
VRQPYREALFMGVIAYTMPIIESPWVRFDVRKPSQSGRSRHAIDREVNDRESSDRAHANSVPAAATAAPRQFKYVTRRTAEGAQRQFAPAGSGHWTAGFSEWRATKTWMTAGHFSAVVCATQATKASASADRPRPLVRIAAVPSAQCEGHKRAHRGTSQPG